jgi:hypothetical protein
VCSWPIYTAAGAYRLYSPTRGEALARHRGCGGAAIQPRAVARIWHGQRQTPGQATSRPSAGHAPCAAPCLVPHVARQRVGRRAGLRHGATLRLSGAAHQWAQRRTDTLGATRRARAEPAVSERAALASGRGSWAWTGPPARPGQLQVWQQSLAGMALQERRVVIRQQKSPDRRDWDLPR